MLKRRSLLAGAALAPLAAPTIASAAGRQLVYVPRAALSSLDPIWTTAQVTVEHSHGVFDMLYGVDDQLRPRPQMAAGHSLSADGLVWTIGLRDGLLWHDGEPVLARDCVASLERWSQRDPFGRLLAAQVVEWRATDDRTLAIRLRQPFGALPDALAHPTGTPAFMMPERLARTPVTEQVSQIVGSGPLRFLPTEYRPGVGAVYARFDRYQPRDEPAVGTAGGKRMFFDRVEWQVIPDDATAAAALQAGSIDWWALANPDLVPLLKSKPGIRVQTADPMGLLFAIRFNMTATPTDNRKLRKVLLSAIDQAVFMPSIGGDDASAWRTCRAMFSCTAPGVTEVGAPLMDGPKEVGALREAVRAAGYAGEKVVVLNATDYSLTAPLGVILADLLTRLGMNVDLQQIDFGTMVQRRQSRAPIDKGGWNVFITLAPGAVTANPGLNVFVDGGGASGWFGWYDSPRVVALSQEWAASMSDSERAARIRAIQEIVFDDAPSIPLGILFPRTAMRAELTGFLPGSVNVPWNLRRS